MQLLPISKFCSTHIFEQLFHDQHSFFDCHMNDDNMYMGQPTLR